MAGKLGDFTKTAQRLARNPLGIIALFIVLVYAIAGLVVGYSAQHLDKGERLLLVWFLVLFPLAVLAAFFRLVTRHHYKLYAPTDFLDKEGFFRTQTPDEQKHRLEREVLAIQKAEEMIEPEETSEEGASAAEIATGVVIRHAYALAEELAFREIEAEFGVPVQRNVGFGSSMLLDGVFSPRGVLTAIEITYVRGKLWERRVREAMDQVAHMPLPPGMPLLIAVVTEGMSSEMREALLSRFDRTLGLWQTGQSIWLKVYDLAELKVKYGFGSDSA